MMLSKTSAIKYGIEDVAIEPKVKPEIEIETIASLEAVISDIANTYSQEITLIEKDNVISNEVVYVHINSQQLEQIKNFIVKVIKTVWDFIKKIYYKIKTAVTGLWRKITKTENDWSAVEKQLNENAKKQKEGKVVDINKNKGVEHISLEDGSKEIDIHSLQHADLSDEYKGTISIDDFNKLLVTFNKNINGMNSYFQQIDTHLKTVSKLDEEVVLNGNAGTIVSHIKNKPNVPSSFSVKEFDFLTIGKVGGQRHFIEPQEDGVKSIGDAFKKNMPLLITNVGSDPLSVSVNKKEDLTSITNEWTGQMRKALSSLKLAGQYTKMAEELLGEKEKEQEKVQNKLNDVAKKGGGDKETMSNISAYAHALQSQVMYITAFVKLMYYYTSKLDTMFNDGSKTIERVSYLCLEY